MHLARSADSGQRLLDDESIRHLIVFGGSGTFVVLWVMLIAVVYSKVFHYRAQKQSAQKDHKLTTSPSSATSAIIEMRRKSRANSLFKNVNPYSAVRES